MTKEPTREQPRPRRTRRKAAPGSSTLEVVDGAGRKRDEEAASPARGVPVSHLFRTQPIRGTELKVRDASMGQTEDMFHDATDAELDDHEFAVRAVHRQVLGEPNPTIEEVRTWDDDQLLAAARAMLSFPPLQVSINGVPQPPREQEPVPDPLTFTAFREALAAGPKRMYSSLADTARRISELGIQGPSMFNTTGLIGAIASKKMLGALGLGVGLDGAFAGLHNPKLDIALESITRGPAIFSAIPKNVGVSVLPQGLGISAIPKNLDVSVLPHGLFDSPALTMKLPEVDFMKGPFSQIGALTDTTAIAGSLAKLQASTRAMRHLAKPIDFVTSQPMVMPDIRPYHPEVDAIRELEAGLGERLEQIAQTQAKTSQIELEVLTGQAELIRTQGITVGQLVLEMKGLRSDQRWPNRAVIVAAFLALCALVVGILALARP